MTEQAIVVQATGASGELTWPSDLAEMQGAVAGDEQTGALIEYVPQVAGTRFILPDGRDARIVDIIVNEEGLLLDLAFNVGASIFANGGRIHGPHYLCGPCIIVYDDVKGGEMDRAERRMRAQSYITGALLEAATDGFPERPDPNFTVFSYREPVWMDGEEE